MYKENPVNIINSGDNTNDGDNVHIMNSGDTLKNISQCRK